MIQHALISPSASRFEHFDGARPDVGADGAGRQAPLLLDERPVIGGDHRTLAGQTRPHVTHFAAAHRVGLTRQRHRPAAGPADRAGRQVQIADRVRVPGAVGALVESHGPAAHPLPRIGDHSGGGADVFFGDAGDYGDPVGRIVLEEGRHRLPAVGVLGDEFGVDVAVLDQQVQQTVEQRQIGAGLDLQEQVGLLGGGGAARIDDDQLGARLESICHPQIQDGMAVGHVRADDEKQLRAIEVGVGPRWAVSTQRLLEPGPGAGHAQPRVRLDVHGPQRTFGQLVGQILCLDGHLARHIQRDGIRAVLVDNGAQPSAGLGNGVVDRGGNQFLVARRPQQRRRQPPVVRGHHLGVRGPLGAQAARSWWDAACPRRHGR